MNCNYKVKIKDIQNKYQFKIFCKTYDDTEIQEDIDTLEDDVEALQEENLYLNNLVEQAFDKKEVEGEELSINDTIEAKMNVSLYGNTKQDGEPTPDTPVEIQSVTGNNKVVVSNKNLFDKDNANILNGYINGATKTYQELSTAKSCYISIKPNTTYTISKISSQRFGLATFNTEIINGTKATIIGSPKSTDTSYTITTGGNDKYLVVFYYLSTADTLSEETIRNSIQIEQGTTATSYVPHKETIYELDLGNIELCKIGDYQDYFYKSGSIWYLHKEINKITSYNGETITTSYISTTGELSTGAKVYYVVTPTDTKITDTTLISQLEALKTAMSYTEQTNISQINNDIPFILKVTALASYNSRIVALENAILNANRSTQTKNARKSNKIIEEPKKEVVDDNKDENIIKEEE